MFKGLSKKQILAIVAICIACFTKQIYMVINVVVSNIVDAYPTLDTALVSTLTTTPKNITGLITALVMGVLLTKVNKKHAYVVLLIAQIVFAGLYYVIGLTGGSFWALYVATMVVGLVYGGHAVVVNTLLRENFDEKKAAAFISLYCVFVNGGQVVYQTLAGSMAAGHDGADWYRAFLPGLWFTIPALILFIILFPKEMGVSRTKEASAESGEEKEKFSFGVFSLGLLVILIINYLYYTAQNGYNSGLSLYVVKENNLGTSVQTALAANLNKIANVIISATYPFWQKIFKKWMVPMGMLVTTIACFIFFLPPSLTNAYIAATLMGIGTALNFGSVAAKAISCIKPGFGSLAAGLVVVTTNVAGIFAVQIYKAIGPVIGEGSVGRFGWATVFAGIGFVLACLAYGRDGKMMHKWDKKPEAAPAEA